MKLKMTLMLAAAVAVASSAVLAGCEQQPQTEPTEQDAPRMEFVRIVDRTGQVWFFRPHMVTEIEPIYDESPDINKCQIIVAGMPRILMNCSADKAAKLVKDR